MSHLLDVGPGLTEAQRNFSISPVECVSTIKLDTIIVLHSEAQTVKCRNKKKSTFLTGGVI